MASIAQLAEHQIVALRVTGSSPVARPLYPSNFISLIIFNYRINKI